MDEYDAIDNITGFLQLKASYQVNKNGEAMEKYHQPSTIPMDAVGGYIVGYISHRMVLKIIGIFIHNAEKKWDQTIISSHTIN